MFIQDSVECWTVSFSVLGMFPDPSMKPTQCLRYPNSIFVNLRLLWSVCMSCCYCYCYYCSQDGDFIRKQLLSRWTDINRFGMPHATYVLLLPLSRRHSCLRPNFIHTPPIIWWAYPAVSQHPLSRSNSGLEPVILTGITQLVLGLKMLAGKNKTLTNNGLITCLGLISSSILIIILQIWTRGIPI